MSTTHPCPSCGATLETGDRFCPSCGRPADPLKTGPAGSFTTNAGVTCPYCGQVNTTGGSTCSACGARIAEPAPASPPDPARSGPRRPIGTFHSWKFTLGVGAILVIALIVLVSTRQGPEPARSAGDPHDTGMVERIRELQARTDQHPDDADALLEFANLLYDVRFFERAAAMYARYLAIRPENADARVDLGTSYFQLAFSQDSGGDGAELTAKAESCFLEAIRQKPDHQLAHFNLGIIHLHRGDTPGANEWFRKCVVIDPNTEAAKRAQQLISQHVQNNPS